MLITGICKECKFQEIHSNIRLNHCNNKKSRYSYTDERVGDGK